MMDAQTIRAIAQESARKAKRHGKKPWHPETLEDVTQDNLRHIPFLGDYVPKGWELAEPDSSSSRYWSGDGQSWFVDKSGWGGADEPALSVEQFLEQAREWLTRNPGGGFAITEESQFQIYIGGYLKQASPLKVPASKALSNLDNPHSPS